jgi:hypothetical protein
MKTQRQRFLNPVYVENFVAIEHCQVAALADLVDKLLKHSMTLRVQW